MATKRKTKKATDKKATQISFFHQWRDAFGKPDNGLTMADWAILCALHSYMQRKQQYCWPGYGTIAKRAKCSDSTAKRRIRELEKQGWIKVKRKKGTTKDGRQYHEPNVYCPNIPPSHD